MSTKELCLAGWTLTTVSLSFCLETVTPKQGRRVAYPGEQFPHPSVNEGGHLVILSTGFLRGSSPQTFASLFPCPPFFYHVQSGSEEMPISECFVVCSHRSYRSSKHSTDADLSSDTPAAAGRGHMLLSSCFIEVNQAWSHELSCWRPCVE